MQLDFLYPIESTHKRWDHGFHITATITTWDQVAFVLSVHIRTPMDETQETLCTSAFSRAHVKAKKSLFIKNAFSFFFFPSCNLHDT